MGREDEIKLIAYQIWEGEGFVNGRESEHWFRAEAIWEGKNQKPARKPKAASAKTRTAKAK